MQVPERLALIGGSILLASTLVFTLKSQASQILPKLSHPISSIYDHAGDTQKSVDFDSNFQQAQKNGWTTGQWGTSNYYIDKDMNLHVGKGNLQDTLYHTLGNDKTNAIKTINIDQPVVAPADSSLLFAGTNGDFQSINTNITNIDGLSNVDTSQVTNMSGMLAHNANVQSLDLSNWNTSQVTSLAQTFDFDHSLTHIDVSNWDVSNVMDMGATFGDNFSLEKLDLSHWTNNKVNSMGYMFNQDFNLKAIDLSGIDMSNALGNESTILGSNGKLGKITLNDKGNIDESNFPASTWQNGNQVIASGQLNTGHAGTWIKQ